jgi:sulfate permease, SulP family
MPERPPRALLPGWVRGYDRAWLRGDLVAGVTVAAMLIPQAMAYAALAGMPPITGLYAAVVPLVLYALLGTSSHIGFGPVALVSLLTASALDPLARGETARYVALAGGLALLVGLIFLLLGALRAGALVNVISHPVISGFTSAAAIVIAFSQARDLFGIDMQRAEHFPEAVAALAVNIGATHPPTLAIGLVSLAVLLIARRVRSQLPAALAVMAAATVVVWSLGLAEDDVAVLGAVPAGLSSPLVPDLGLADLRALLLPAVVITLVGFAETIAIAKAIAARTRERIDPNRELLASGGANVSAGLFSAFPVAGSFSRTAVNYEAGARSPLAGVITAAVIAITLLLFTGALYHVPRAVLAAIVVAAVLGLVDFRAAARTLRTSPADGAVWVATFAATLGLGVEVGLAAGVGLNLAIYVVQRIRPHLVELGRVQGTTMFRNIARFPTVTDPRVAILRLDAPLDFLTAAHVSSSIAKITVNRPELDLLILDCSGIGAVDASGLHMLEGLQSDLATAGVDLRLATLRGPVRDVLRRAGLWDELADRCHAGIDGALEAAGEQPDAALRRPGAGEQAPPELV